VVVGTAAPVLALANTVTLTDGWQTMSDLMDVTFRTGPAPPRLSGRTSRTSAASVFFWRSGRSVVFGLIGMFGILLAGVVYLLLTVVFAVSLLTLAGVDASGRRGTSAAGASVVLLLSMALIAVIAVANGMAKVVIYRIKRRQREADKGASLTGEPGGPA
jgi:uncharacterized integral membrane protein